MHRRQDRAPGDQQQERAQHGAKEEPLPAEERDVRLAEEPVEPSAEEHEEARPEAEREPVDRLVAPRVEEERSREDREDLGLEQGGGELRVPRLRRLRAWPSAR